MTLGHERGFPPTYLGPQRANLLGETRAPQAPAAMTSLPAHPELQLLGAHFLAAGRPCPTAFLWEAKGRATRRPSSLQGMLLGGRAGP